MSAAATRATIRRAAAELFLADGYSATTMKAIAGHAGVGERTLYDGFASKPVLFEHVVGVAITGDEELVAVADRPEFRAALREPDPGQAVTLFARYSAEVLERAAPLIAVAIESAGADPALRRFADAGAAATRDNARAFVGALAGHGLVGVTAADEVEELSMAVYALVAPLAHRHLRGDLGWSASRYRRWLESSLRRILSVS